MHGPDILANLKYLSLVRHNGIAAVFLFASSQLNPGAANKSAKKLLLKLLTEIAS